jgi:site-specific DNA-methyltransferase (adenine-specific)
MKPYYQDEATGITIHQGDCLLVMAALDSLFDLVVFSPPYNLGNTTGGGFVKQLGGMAYQRSHYSPETPLGKRGGAGKWNGGALAYGYDEYDDAMPHDKYVAWQNQILNQCWRHLNGRGAIFYNHKPRVLDGHLIAPMDYVPAELKPYIRQEIIWARAGGVNFSPSFYCPTHERIVVIAKPDWRLKSKGASGVGDVWTITQETKNPHPAPFPLELPAKAIETTGARSVLDCFSGSGTTLVAARNAGIEATGIELSERWCEYARQRLVGPRKPKTDQEVLQFNPEQADRLPL